MTIVISDYRFNFQIALAKLTYTLQIRDGPTSQYNIAVKKLHEHTVHVLYLFVSPLLRGEINGIHVC